MKKTLYLLLIALLLLACDETTTEPENEQEGTQLFKSHNVKTEGKQYYTFANNTGTTTEPVNWDIAFGSVELTVETAPCQFFTMSNDPVIFCDTNASIATIEAASLADVTTIPNSTEFKNDISRGTPLIGKSWFNSTFDVNHDVYVIKTCAGNFALLEISKYDIDMVNHQITSINWTYKYNNNGSTDFSTSASVSFDSQNAYDETRYFSFENGDVAANESYDIKIIGSALWLGPNVKAKKLEGSSIPTLTTIIDENFSTDVLPNYITNDWYSYGDGHLLTPNDYVYVVKTTDNKNVAFEITNYYDDEGNSGTFTIKWKYLN